MYYKEYKQLHISNECRLIYLLNIVFNAKIQCRNLFCLCLRTKYKILFVQWKEKGIYLMLFLS